MINWLHTKSDSLNHYQMASNKMKWFWAKWNWMQQTKILIQGQFFSWKKQQNNDNVLVHYQNEIVIIKINLYILIWEWKNKMSPPIGWNFI